jgi:hypothetical protein
MRYFSFAGKCASQGIQGEDHVDFWTYLHVETDSSDPETVSYLQSCVSLPTDNTPQDWNIKRICFEVDTEPYAMARDAMVKSLASQSSVDVSTFVSHTLYVREVLVISHSLWVLTSLM